MTKIIHFSTPTLPSLDQVGGKALSLVKMTQAGLPVPPGFVLTVDFFAPWNATLEASPAWADVLRAGPDDLGAACLTLMGQGRSMRFTPQQVAQLDGAIRDLQSTTRASFFAVRSSSPHEDLEGASFAGGYESTLGVTPTLIHEAILHAFVSSLDERVFVYKQEHGFPIHQPRMAVIVQQQIDAQSAGVAFSLNPLNNCYDEAVINANFGLGESVVSGEVDADLFVVDKIDRKILETQIGGKEVVVTLNDRGSVTRSTPPPTLDPCLSPAQIQDLTDLLVRVEESYGLPIDCLLYTSPSPRD